MNARLCSTSRNLFFSAIVLGGLVVFVGCTDQAASNAFGTGGTPGLLNGGANLNGFITGAGGLSDALFGTGTTGAIGGTTGTVVGTTGTGVTTLTGPATAGTGAVGGTGGPSTLTGSTNAGSPILTPPVGSPTLIPPVGSPTLSTPTSAVNTTGG